MARGKNISVYLIDGVANGKVKAQISNWNGIAYKIPKELLPECKDFEAFRQSGVYFLFGYKSVYVGQAEVRKSGKGIYQRIVEHVSDKYRDVWDEVVIFTTKDNSLGRTDISYLENRFYNKAKAAKRFFVQNGNEPTVGTVTEEKEDELEEFIDQAELILGALGYKVFEPVVGPVTEDSGQGIWEFKQSEIPPLPDRQLKIGAYIRKAMRNLSLSGYTFEAEVLEAMFTSEWSKEHFRTAKPFMKRYVEGKSDNKDTEGKYVRFWSEIFTFGDEQVYISKEWYEGQRQRFENWYKGLR